MMQIVPNKPTLGCGIYSVSEVSLYLDLPYQKVHRWINDFWDRRLSSGKVEKYSWGEQREKSVNFYTLIEFYTFYQLRRYGVSVKKILHAHTLLCNLLRTPFPFATSNLLTDGGSILYQLGDNIIDVEEGFPYNLKEIIIPFCKKIEFGHDEHAARFFPGGKSVCVVIDPHHQLGKPVIVGTNIKVHSIYSMYKAGDSPHFISTVYEISNEKVASAIQYFNKLYD